MTDNPQVETTENTSRRRISRRGFLKVLGIGAGGLVVGAVVGGPTILREAQLGINQFFLNGALPTPDGPESPFMWFEIAPDNQATLYMPKIEMGQGIHTTLAQMAAEELELDWETVSVKTPDTESAFNPELVFTFGSTSTIALYEPTRKIGATMKGPLAATMIAGGSVDASDLKKPVYVVATSDEEIGLLGAKYIVENSELLKASQPEYGVVAEPTKLIPVYAHKGGGHVNCL